jgi:hypothetical protein
VLLPYEAYVSLDAIVRTSARMLWTKRKLLEWKTASESERGKHGSFLDTLHAMELAPILAAAVTVALAYLHPGVLLLAGPLLALWFVSPGIAWWLSRPIAERATRLTAPQQVFLE